MHVDFCVCTVNTNCEHESTSLFPFRFTFCFFADCKKKAKAICKQPNYTVCRRFRGLGLSRVPRAVVLLMCIGSRRDRRSSLVPPLEIPRVASEIDCAKCLRYPWDRHRVSCETPSLPRLIPRELAGFGLTHDGLAVLCDVPSSSLWPLCCASKPLSVKVECIIEPSTVHRAGDGTKW